MRGFERSEKEGVRGEEVNGRGRGQELEEEEERGRGRGQVKEGGKMGKEGGRKQTSWARRDASESEGQG